MTCCVSFETRRFAGQCPTPYSSQEDARQGMLGRKRQGAVKTVGHFGRATCTFCSGDIEDVGDLKHILTALNTYHTLPAIVDRLCFTLGNLTHTAENNRVVVMQKLDALPVVVRLLETQMEADQQVCPC